MKVLKLLIIMIVLPLSIFALNQKNLAHTINLSGKERMLSQKITKEALLIKSHIEEEANLAKLLESRNLFHKTLHGLQYGDKALKLKAIHNKKVQTQLQVVQKKWAHFDQHIQKVLSKKANKTTYLHILKESLPLLEALNQLVTHYVALKKTVKSKREQAINLAGKERMLTQKMAKEILAISQAIDKKSNQNTLQQSKAFFTKILMGLQHGDNSLTLQGTKLPKIQKQLKIVQEQWQNILPLLKGEFKNPKRNRDIIHKLDKLLIEADNAVKLFEKSIYREKQSLKLSSLVTQFMHKKNMQNYTINIAGKQRMLTQLMTKLAIQISLDIDKSKAKKELHSSIILFEKTHNALSNGDSSLQLLACKDKKIKNDIKDIQSQWQAFKKQLNSIIDNTKNEKEALAYLIKHNQNLLQLSNKLVQQLKSKEKHQTFIEKTRTEIVDMAGRQRMLVEKMTKEKLLIFSSPTFSSYKKKLQETIYLFETSLYKLINGDKNKIIKPSNKRVIQKLKNVQKLWLSLKPLYQKEPINKTEIMHIVQKAPLLRREMNQAVTLSETVADY